MVISKPHSDSLAWLRVSTLGRDGNQYVVTNPAGQELIRGSLTTDALGLQGSDADEHLLIDLTQGNAIPESGLRFLAGHAPFRHRLDHACCHPDDGRSNTDMRFVFALIHKRLGDSSLDHR